MDTTNTLSSPGTGTRRRIAVVGCGASGMAAALALNQAGHDVEVIERSGRPGGRMGTSMLGERSVSLGGKNIGRRYARFRAWVRELGDFEFEHFGLNSSRVRDGRVVTFDDGHRWRGAAEILARASARDLFRFWQLYRAVKAGDENRFLDGSRFEHLARKFSDRRPTDHFSAAFCDDVIRPMTVRMNGAEASEVTLESLGTNLGMLLDSYEQLAGGLDPVFERFAARVPIRCAEVESVIVENAAVKGVRINLEGRRQTWRYDAVLLATPAPIAGALLESCDPILAEQLRTVRYFPVGVAVAQYEQPVFTSSVRAFVFPATSPLSNAGAYGTRDLDMVRYTFSGGAARELLAGNPSPNELANLGEERLSQLVSMTGNRRIACTGVVLGLGLCAYRAEHYRLRELLRARTERIQGLELTGDYVCGASVEACFRAAHQAVERLRPQLQRAIAHAPAVASTNSISEVFPH